MAPALTHTRRDLTHLRQAGSALSHWSNQQMSVNGDVFACLYASDLACLASRFDILSWRWCFRHGSGYRCREEWESLFNGSEVGIGRDSRSFISTDYTTTTAAHEGGILTPSPSRYACEWVAVHDSRQCLSPISWAFHKERHCMETSGLISSWYLVNARV